MAYNAQADLFARYTPLKADPGRLAVAVTPSGSDLTTYAKALWIGGAGNVEIIPIDQVLDTPTVVFAGCAAGTLLPVGARRVVNTNTTATLIIAILE